MEAKISDAKRLVYPPYDMRQLLRCWNARDVLKDIRIMTEGLQTQEERLSGLIEFLKKVLEKSSKKKSGHAYGVGSLCERIVREMGLPGREALETIAAGYIHDIGKFRMGSALLEKPELTEFEGIVLAFHSQISEEMCGKFLGPNFDCLKPILRHHHERWDGKMKREVGKGGGYPDGLRGEEIPLGARVVAVADAYDAMTKMRPYRVDNEGKPIIYSRKEALNIIEMQSGTQFDPAVVRAFLKSMRAN